MDEDDFISKTRRKKHMTQLQDVGKDLVRLSPEQDTWLASRFVEWLAAGHEPPP